MAPEGNTAVALDNEFIVQAQELTKSVVVGQQPLHILKGISLEINRSESVAIVGKSGSGKSTLLSLLAGLDQPSTGEVALAGNNITQLDEDGRAAVRGDHVGFVFQSFQLVESLTALENVLLPLELAGLPGAEARAVNLLTRVGLAERMDHYPSQLSGGEQQRVAIARAFSSAPDILFADEPTGNLDSETGDSIIELLFEINREQGTTLILVTHDDQLAEQCDRRIHLAAGEIVTPN